jgi:plastocyanin
VRVLGPGCSIIAALIVAGHIAAHTIGSPLGGAYWSASPPDSQAYKHFKTALVRMVTNSKTIGAYKPHSITLHVGQKVVFKNVSDTAHTVTSDGNKFHSPNIAIHQSWSYTPKHTRVFKYHCIYHARMRGTIVVRR